MITLIMSCTVIFIGYLLFKAYRNTHDIQIRNINIASDDDNSSAALSILHLSDLHLENISLSPEALRQKLKYESVDMIALTGDFLDRKRSIPKLLPYLDVLRAMKPVHGIYAVLGNHDYVLNDKDLTNLISLLEQNDIHVLRNQSETISASGQTVNIIGIDDDSTNRSDLPLAYQQVNHGTNIVLTHDPTVVLDMADYSFDYLMAGHFHGGQICYPKAYHLANMGKLARQKIIKGLHSHNKAPFYISEGLGQTGLNIRVGSRPEITFHQVPIDVKSKSA